MYIIVKQLSNANPTKNRQIINSQKFAQYAVPIPAAKPIKLHPANAGIRPNLSAIQPNNKPPQMAPKKKTDCDNVGR